MEERLKQVFADVLRLEPHEVHDELSPKVISAWDSMQHLSLVMVLEETFGVTFSADEMNDMYMGFGVLKRIVLKKVCDA